MSQTSSATSSTPPTPAPAGAPTNPWYQDAYDASAKFGRFWAGLSAIIGTVLGVIFIGFGIYLLLKKNNRQQITATITAINGVSSGNPSCGDTGDGKFSCRVSLHYVYNNVPHDVSTSYTGSVKYYLGQQIQITVDPKQPNVVDIDQSPKWGGFAFVGVGVFVILIVWAVYWLTGKSKVFAAAEGTGAFLNIATGGRL